MKKRTKKRRIGDPPKMFGGLTASLPTPPDQSAPCIKILPKLKTHEKLGSRYMRELGRRGGKVNVARHGSEQMAAIGKKGGQHPKK